MGCGASATSVSAPKCEAAAAEAAAAAAAALPPLVFVHGLLGSHLVDPETGSRRFLTARQVLNLQDDKFQLPLEREFNGRFVPPTGAQVSDGLSPSAMSAKSYFAPPPIFLI